MSIFFLSSSRSLYFELVIIEDTLGLVKDFISSKTVQNNYFPPDDNLESDWLVFDIEDPLWVDELLSR